MCKVRTQRAMPTPCLVLVVKEELVAIDATDETA